MAGAAVVLALAGVVGAAVVSNQSHPRPSADESAVASAVVRSEASAAGRARRAAAPVLVSQASGDLLLRRGFGHLHLAAPVSYANLTVFPVYSSSAAKSGPTEFALLGEGMSNGAVRASEPGAGVSAVPAGMAVPAASVTNAEEGAQHRGANLLLVSNSSPQPTYVPDGQVVPGGDQDRGVASDVIVPARSANVSLPAFCVEHGRSSGPSPLFKKDVAIAVPSVRYAMQVVGEQQPVWDSVAVATDCFDAHRETGTYNGLLESQVAQTAAARYAGAVLFPVQEAAHGRPMGVVVAINGKVVCADLYRSPTLFAQLWPSLARSYALQAAMVNGKGTGGEPPALRDASAWVTGLDAAPGAQIRHADLTQVARVAVGSGAGIRSAAVTADPKGKRALLHEAFFTRDAALTD